MTKGKRIVCPIREGIISKIYSIAYGEPTTGYQIAKRLETPHINKVYTLLKQYRELFDIETVKDGERVAKKIKSKATILLNEIEKELNATGESLNDHERNELLKFLDTTFREFVKMANQKNQIWNVVDLFYNVVYGFCSIRIFYDEFINSNEFKEQFKNIPEYLTDKFFECIKEALKESFGEYVEDAVRFGDENKTLIRKLLKIVKPHPLLVGCHMAWPFVCHVTTKVWDVISQEVIVNNSASK